MLSIGTPSHRWLRNGPCEVNVATTSRGEPQLGFPYRGPITKLRHPPPRITFSDNHGLSFPMKSRTYRYDVLHTALDGPIGG